MSSDGESAERGEWRSKRGKNGERKKKRMAEERGMKSEKELPLSSLYAALFALAT
jgi:hypothetical protein